MFSPLHSSLSSSDIKYNFKFKASKVPFPEFGDYRLTILADPGTRGGFTAKVSGLKYAKRAKRTVFDTDILLPPIVRSVEPSEALLQDTVEDLTIHGSFFQPAPKVRFSRLGETVGITGAVTVDESTIILDLDVGKLRPGTWDVTVENTDGGSGVLKSAFTVLNVAAKDLGMTPNVATNGEVVEAVITGEDLQEGLALQLVQGAETILGRNTDRVSSQLVTTEFDLNGRPMGNWDLHVTNPGAAAAVLPVALVVEKASPQVTSVTPATVHDTGSPFTIEIFGNYFDTGASVELARAGESSVPADSATATSATRIVATLDTAGRDVGLWDVVVRNPDGKTGTLADGLEVKFAMRVLLLSDNGAEGPIKTALTAAGMLVTDAGLYSKWDPASGALDKIDVVVWPQGAAWGSAPTDNADKALEAFVKNGGGLIRTEWGAYDIATLGTGPTRLHSMMPVTAPGGNYAYGSNWTVTDTSHEMVQGLPTAWSESAAGYSQVTVDSHAKVVIQNSLGYAILTYRTDSGGTFIHLNHSMTENNVTISDNVLKLIVNMVKFASPR